MSLISLPPSTNKYPKIPRSPTRSSQERLLHGSALPNSPTQAPIVAHHIEPLREGRFALPKSVGKTAWVIYALLGKGFIYIGSTMQELRKRMSRGYTCESAQSNPTRDIQIRFKQKRVTHMLLLSKLPSGSSKQDLLRLECWWVLYCIWKYPHLKVLNMCKPVRDATRPCMEIVRVRGEAPSLPKKRPCQRELFPGASSSSEDPTPRRSCQRELFPDDTPSYRKEALEADSIIHTQPVTPRKTALESRCPDSPQKAPWRKHF